MKNRPQASITLDSIPADSSASSAQPRRRTLTRRGPAPLALEPRVMFDGATPDAALAAAAGADAVVRDSSAQRTGEVADRQVPAAVAAPSSAAVRHEIVFIEDNVQDYQQLVAGVRDGVQVVVLDHTKDGLQQMLAALQGSGPVDAIHLVTHGAAGQIDLGTARVNDASLGGFSAQLAQLGQALGEHGDFLIYGCDVGQGSAGAAFVERLAALTGADVAASSDTTGAAVFGGDWDLEVRTGAIDSVVLHAEGYQGRLAVNAIDPIAGDNRVNPGEQASVVISGTVDNSGQSVRLTVTDGTNTITREVSTSSNTWTTTIDMTVFKDGAVNVYVKQTNSGTASDGNKDMSVVVTKDTIAPDTTITSAPPSTSGTSVSFTFSGSDANRYQYSLDGGLWTDTTSTLTLNGLTAATHTLNVRALDAAGNVDATAATHSWTVQKTNTAPVASGSVVLEPVGQLAANPAGKSVAALFGASYTDADEDALGGIAITAYTPDPAAGRWEYNDGSGWKTVGAVSSAASAFTLKASDTLRFTPSGSFTGAAPALSAKLIDAGGSVVSGATRDASTGGGTSSISVDAVKLTTSVKPAYSLETPKDQFSVLLTGVKYDPVNDTQANAADTDLVGATNVPLLLGAYDTDSRTMYYSVRIGDPTLSKGVPVFSGVVLLGLDTDNNGDIDIFLGVDGRNNGLGVVTFAPGADANISPSTSSITQQQSVNGPSNRDYTYTLTGGNVGADRKPDAWLTFKVPFDVLAARVQSLSGGQVITPASSMGMVLLTLTQDNSINGDIGGIGPLSKAQSSMTWRDLGLLQPLNLSAPTLAGIGGIHQFTENGSPVAIAPSASFNDVDSANFTGGKLQVTVRGDAGADTSKDQLSFASDSVSASNGVLRVNGVQVGTYTYLSGVLTADFSAANVNIDQVAAVVRAVSFSTDGEAPPASSRTVQFKVTDSDNNGSALSSVKVLVQPVNDAPTISGAATALNRAVVSKTVYAPASATTADALVLGKGYNSALAVADVDAGSSPVTVTLGVDKGILQLYSGGATTPVAGTVTIDGVTISGSGAGALRMTGSVASINAFLAGTNASAAKVLYQPGLSLSGAATLSLSIDDNGNTGLGGPKSASATVGSITISSPALTGTVAGNLLEDNGVSNGSLAASGTLNYGITSTSFVSNTLGTGALGTLVGNGNTWNYTVNNGLAQIQALRDGQTIQESYQVATTNGIAYVRVTISGVNDAPTLSATASGAGYTENADDTALFAGATASFGAGETDQAITRLTMTATNVFDGDQLVIDGTAFYLDQVSNQVLTANGYRVDIVQNAGTSQLTIHTGEATASAVQALVSGLGYRSVSDNPTNYGANTSRSFTITGLRDSGGTANGGQDTAVLNITRTVNITAVNDAPVVKSAQVTLNQNSSITIGAGYLSANDPDNVAAELHYTVTGLPLNGTLKLDGVAVTSATSFTQQDIDSGRLSYTAKPFGSNQTDAFVVQVSDGSATVGGKTVDINIITTQYAPNTEDGAVATNEDVGYVFRTLDFAFRDGNTGDALGAVELFTLPAAGKLQLRSGDTWTDVNTPGVTVSAVDIGAGKLRFMPGLNESAPDYASFNFKVVDATGLASSDAVMKVSVAPVNDAPVASGTAITTNEDTPASGTLPSATDAELDPVSYAKASDPAHGTVVVQADGSYTYTPVANYHGADSFSYTVSDGKGGSNTYTVNVTVTPVDDAPTVTVAPVEVNQGQQVVIGKTHLEALDGDTTAGNLVFTVTSPPGKGSLTIDDVVVTSFTQQDIQNNKLVYKANSFGSSEVDAFTVKVTDGTSTVENKTVAITIRASNLAPTSTGGAVTTLEDTAYAFKPADFNFTDANPGDTLDKVQVFAPSTGKLQTRDGNGAWTDVGASVLVTASDIADGKLQFVPAANANGSPYADFDYKVLDPAGAASSIVRMTVNVTPVDDAPTLSVAPVEVSQGQQVVIEKIYLKAEDVDTTAAKLVFTVTSAPGKGQLTIDNVVVTSFTQQDILNNKLVYKADVAGSDQSDAFTVKVTDGTSTVENKTVAITIRASNLAPTSTGGAVTTPEDTAYAFKPADFNFTDANPGDTLAKVQVFAPSTGKLQTRDGNGAWTDVGASVLVTASDIADGKLQFVPAANANGSPYADFDYKVLDPAGAASSIARMTVNVTPVNDAPAAGSRNLMTAEDTGIGFTLPGGTDVDGDSLTYTQAVAPQNGAVTLNGDGSYTYTPFANYNGTDSFSYTISDGKGGSATYTVTVTVTPVDDAPTVTVAPVEVNQGQQVVIGKTHLEALDGDTTAGNLVFTVTSPPGKGSLTIDDVVVTSFTQQDIQNNKLVYKANSFGSSEVDAFTVKVTDGTSTVENKTVAITIRASNLAPTSTGGAVTTPEDTAYAFKPADFNFTDANPGDTLDKVQVFAPSTGKLQTRDGNGAWTDVGASVLVTASDIADGKLQFVPAANANGSPYADFDYKVLDPAGAASSIARMTVNVTPVNDVPVASGATITTNENTPVSGSLPAALDADQDPVSYAKAGDPAHGTVEVKADGSYTYTPAPGYNGADSFSFTVSDGQGGSNVYTVSVTVGPVNDAPVAANGELTTSEDTPASSRLPKATDADLDAVSYAKASNPSHGTVEVSADGTYTYTPVANYHGGDRFSYTVSDGNGGSNTYTVNIMVSAVNDAPEGSGAAIATDEDTPVSGRLPAATDVDKDVLSYEKASNPAHGTVEVRADGSYTYTPAPGYHGADSFSFTVSDGKGGSNTYTVGVTVKPVNDAPVAAGASIATSEDTPVSGRLPAANDPDKDAVSYAGASGPSHGTVEVKADGSYTYTPAANYSGPDSFSFTVSDGKGGSNTYTVGVTVTPVNDAPVASGAAIATNEDTPVSGMLPAANDPDKDAVSYAAAGGPSHGTVAIKADGSYTYTPAADYSGADSFRYTVSDGNGGSNTYTVEVAVNPVNDVPTAGGASVTTNEDTPYAGQLPAATDADGDAVGYALGSGAAHGSVTVSPAGQFSYTPAPNYSGADSFSYTISDGKGGSNTYTVSVTVNPVNDAPVAANGMLVTLEDTPASGSLPRATDADGDPVSYAGAGAPSHGTVSIQADGSYRYTPEANYHGADRFTYTVSDGKGGSNTYAVDVTVSPVNDAPEAHGGAGGTGLLGEAMAPVKVPAFTDIDSPVLTYTATLADGSPLPAWLVFDPATLTFSGTPAAGSVGSYAITVTASDGALSASTPVAITVANPPAPLQSVGISAMTRDTGVSSSDFITSDGSAGRTVTGTLGAPLGRNEVVQVSFDGGVNWSTAAVNGAGWSALDNGAHGAGWTIEARVIHTLSGLAGPKAVQAVTLDTSLPAAPSVASFVTSGQSPVITGSAVLAPGEKLQVTVAGATFDVTPQNGTWTLDLSASSPASGKLAELVPGRSYDVLAVVTDQAGNTTRDTTDGEVSVAVPVAPQQAPAPQAPVAAPEPAAAAETAPAPVAAPVAPVAPATEAVAPGSMVGNDSVNLGSGFTGGRVAESSFALQIQRAAELSDVYTRSDGFRTVVAPADQPALVLFQGVPDQYIESGTRLSVTVPSDAFAHTQPKAVVRLAATMQDGSPLPSWVQFNGQTGQFSGQVPDGMKGELRIKLTARDQSGREATALFRLNVGQAKVEGGKAGLTDLLRKTGTDSGARLAGIGRAGK